MSTTAKNTTAKNTTAKHTTAIVVGASMAGLMTARVLADHATRVVVLERDDLDDSADGAVAPRRGVPQGRHAHAILAAGEARIAAWFPGIVDELEAAGAVRGDNGDALWFQAGALKVRSETGIAATCASRPLLEATVRRRLGALPNVSIRSGVKVRALHVHGDRVEGVELEGGEVLHADLVVDCSGRNTPFLAQLASAGFDEPAVSSVAIDMTYATRILRRGADDISGAMYAIVAPTPPVHNRFGVLLPIEGDRWILTIGGFHGDAAPTDEEGYAAFAASLPHPMIAEVLERCEALSGVMTHRLPTNQRRHVEKLRRMPAGFVVLGDAVCSFNPIYGQGMSSAAKQAEALGIAVGRHGLAGRAMPGAFYERAAKVVNDPWQIAAGSDFLHPATTGPKPAGTDMINRYVGKVQLATHSSPAVLRKMVLVQNLLAAPPSLMAPATMARVLLAARRSPAGRPIATAPARPREHATL